MQHSSHTQEYCQNKMYIQQNFILFAGGNLTSERDNKNTAKFLCAAFWYPNERLSWTKCKASEGK